MAVADPLPVIWLPAARAARRDQLLYIAAENPSAALRMNSALLNAAQRLSTLPQSARPGRLPGTRELAVPRTPFLLIYRIDPDEIVILRLLHQRQQRP